MAVFWQAVLTNNHVRLQQSQQSDCCSPQKCYPTSSRNFFQPVFMVQPGENLLDSDSAGGLQLMWLNFPSPYWFSTDSLASVFHREPSASIGRKNPESIQAANGPFARDPGGSAEESP
jgi:hypothetical protein